LRRVRLTGLIHMVMAKPTIAAVIVAIGVVAAALGLAVQSVREIFLPHHGPAPYTLVVLIVACDRERNSVSIRHSIGRSVESTAVQTDAWHHRTDAMTSIAASSHLCCPYRWRGLAKARTTGLRSSHVRSSARMAIVCCGRLCSNHGHSAARPNSGFSSKCCGCGPGVIDVEKMPDPQNGAGFLCRSHVGVNGVFPFMRTRDCPPSEKTAIRQRDRALPTCLSISNRLRP